MNSQSGLNRLEGGTAIAPAVKEFPPGSDQYVYVGVNAGGSGFLGVPLSDVAFDSRGNAYVVPVVVDPPGGAPNGCGYKSAAKLQLSGNGQFEVVELFGSNPAEYITPTTCQEMLNEPDRTRLREVEVDSTGHVFVVSSYPLNANEYIMTYNSSGTETVHNISEFVKSPSAMLLSKCDESKLYLVSSSNDLPNATTRVYRFTIDRSGTQLTIQPDGWVDINNPTMGVGQFGFAATITALQEDPTSCELYAIGFTMERFAPNADPFSSELNPFSTSFRTLPTLAVFDPSTMQAVSSTALDCHSLAMPVAMAFVPGATACTTSTQCVQMDANVCRCDACNTGFCESAQVQYGNANCSGPQNPNLDDILCVLGGFSNYANCPNGDLKGAPATPCTPNNLINLDDILAVLGAFSGIDPCGCQ